MSVTNRRNYCNCSVVESSGIIWNLKIADSTAIKCYAVMVFSGKRLIVNHMADEQLCGVVDAGRPGDHVTCSRPPPSCKASFATYSIPFSIYSINKRSFIKLPDAYARFIRGCFRCRLHD